MPERTQTVKVVTNDPLDLIADDTYQVEILPDIGRKGCFKLYVHINGTTFIRIGNIKREQFLDNMRIV